MFALISLRSPAPPTMFATPAAAIVAGYLFDTDGLQGPPIDYAVITDGFLGRFRFLDWPQYGSATTPSTSLRGLTPSSRQAST